jgi:hypothetical protein
MDYSNEFLYLLTFEKETLEKRRIDYFETIVALKKDKEPAFIRALKLARRRLKYLDTLIDLYTPKL